MQWSRLQILHFQVAPLFLCLLSRHVRHDVLILLFYHIHIDWFILSAIGPSKIPSMRIPKKVGIGAWGIPSDSAAYHGSSDASLFSCSLPVLPHEKCMTSFFRCFLLAIYCQFV